MNSSFAQQQIEELEYLPVPNNIVVTLLKTIFDQNCTFQDISAVAELDASLSFQILKLANSAYYGFRGEIKTIDKAVMLIGIEEVRNLLLALSLINQFKSIRLAKNFDFKKFWLHSLLSASCASLIAKVNPIFEKGAMYVMGLVHDLGRLVMAQIMPDQINIMLLKAKIQKVEPWIIEKESGLSHTNIGQALAERWSIAKDIAEVMEFHHNPLKSKGFHRECSVVNVASFMAKTLENELYAPVKLEPVNSKVLALAGLTYNDFDQLLGEGQKLKNEAVLLTEMLVN